MSTFIYTLQRKVQELQNTLRSLQEQNAQLKNRAKMLSEAAPPGPPPGPPPVASGIQQANIGGLGYGAFVTRTTQAPGASNNFADNPRYSGFNVRGSINGVDTITNYTNVNGILMPANGIQFISPQVLAEIILLNVMQNPNFALTNFQTFEQLLSAMGNAFSTSGAFTPQQLQQIGQLLIAGPQAQGMQTWLKTGFRSANSTGTWIINQNWPF